MSQTVMEREVATGWPVSVDAATMEAQLKAALVVASRDDTLPVLTGVALQVGADGLSTASTDRYKMLITGPAWNDTGETLLVARADVDDLVRFVGREGRQRVSARPVAVDVVPDEGSVTVRSQTTRRSVSVPLVTVGQFPKVAALLPDHPEPGGEAATYGTGHLSAVPSVADHLSRLKRGVAGVTFTPVSAHKPTVVTPANVNDHLCEWTLVLMPMRLPS